MAVADEQYSQDTQVSPEPPSRSPDVSRESSFLTRLIPPYLPASVRIAASTLLFAMPLYLLFTMTVTVLGVLDGRWHEGLYEAKIDHFTGSIVFMLPLIWLSIAELNHFTSSYESSTPALYRLLHRLGLCYLVLHFLLTAVLSLLSLKDGSYRTIFSNNLEGSLGYLALTLIMATIIFYGKMSKSNHKALTS